MEMGRHQGMESHMARSAADTVASEDAEVVVVPRQPGPLSPLGGRARPQDELDVLVEDMFGESTDEGPGVFDLVLLGLGAAISVWAFLSGAGMGWTALGVILVVLGLALPARSILRTYRSRSARRVRRRAIERGYLLDASAPSTGALVDAYEQLAEVAEGSASPLAEQTVTAAHAALVEVATLLDGSAPVTDAEIAYVEKRTAAVRTASARLIRADRVRARARGARTRADEDETMAQRRRRADAVTRAREELESTHRMSSVDQLEALNDVLRRETNDVPR
jgi:hypothetical protein